MSTGLKFGRAPARFDRRSVMTASAVSAAVAPLGPPPASCAEWMAAVERCWGSAGWGMFANDEVGCCTMADGAHQIMVHTASAGFPFVPSDDDVLDAYSALCGYDPLAPLSFGINPTDRGATESDACAFMAKSGIAGHRADAFGSVDPGNLDHVRWAVRLFGACRLGFEVTSGMLDQFQGGRPWDGTGSLTPEGGHDAPVVGYDGTWFYLATWGKIQKASPVMVASCDEAHGELYADWIGSTGKAPSGFDAGQLIANLNQL